MTTAVAFVIAAAAAAGAVARAEAGRPWNREAFALGTLIVNVTVSFMLGLLSTVAPPTATVVGVGALGAYTTFSSFARDAVALPRSETLTRAAAYVLVTCALGIGAAALGIAIAT